MNNYYTWCFRKLAWLVIVSVCLFLVTFTYYNCVFIIQHQSMSPHIEMETVAVRQEYSMTRQSVINTPTILKHRSKLQSEKLVSNIDVKLISARTPSTRNDTKLIKHFREEMPMITMFSTWAPNDNHPKVREITLRNWSMFKPDLIPLYFRTGTAIPYMVDKCGWFSLPVAQTGAGGVPVLKTMFMDATNFINSTFYAFCNGDIIFGEGLIPTLQTIISQINKLPKPFLIIGRRTNVLNVTEKESGTFSSLAHAAKTRGELYGPEAIDFFITDASYPWRDVPQFVVGRNGYDNWLVYTSLRLHHTVIDVTETVLAVHQTTEAGNHEGHTRRFSYYNNKMIKKMFPNITMGSGRTWCAPWVTAHDGQRIVLKIRKYFAKTCHL